MSVKNLSLNNKLIYYFGIIHIVSLPLECCSAYVSQLPESELSGPIIDSCEVEDYSLLPIVDIDVSFSSNLESGDYLNLHNWPFRKKQLYDNDFYGDDRDGLVDRICGFSYDNCVKRDDENAVLLDFLEADLILRKYKEKYSDICNGYEWENRE